MQDNFVKSSGKKTTVTMQDVLDYMNNNNIEVLDYIPHVDPSKRYQRYKVNLETVDVENIVDNLGA